MTNYELMVIINPNLSDDEKNSAVEVIVNAINSKGGNISKTDVWGVKKMAYNINKSSNGYYVLFDLEIDGTSLQEITKSYNLDTRIWRHMFSKKD